MGLDNSIEIKRTDYTNSLRALQIWNNDWDKECKYDFEVCYWRKCWNVRSMIFDCCPNVCNNDNGPLSREDIGNIITGLKKFNSKNWQEDGGSIWDWDDEECPYSKKIKRDIKSLRRLYRLMKKYNLEVYFVDSY